MQITYTPIVLEELPAFSDMGMNSIRKLIALRGSLSIWYMVSLNAVRRQKKRKKGKKQQHKIIQTPISPLSCHILRWAPTILLKRRLDVLVGVIPDRLQEAPVMSDAHEDIGLI